MKLAERAALCAGALLLAAFPSATFAGDNGKSSETKQLDCLAKAIYFEARGEPEEGQRAVGQVVLNRSNHDAYPETICEVVYQNAHRRNACQFSFACDGIADRVHEKEAFRKIRTIAEELLDCSDECGESHPIATSTHYHAVSVSPSWSRKLKKTGQVGHHIFYYSKTA